MIELTAEQREIQEWARDFAKRAIAPRALELDKRPEGPARWELIREGAKAGVFSSNIPEALGGTARDLFSGVLITEELAAACAGCAVLFGASALGITPILLSLEIDKILRFIPPLVHNLGRPMSRSLRPLPPPNRVPAPTSSTGIPKPG